MNNCKKGMIAKFAIIQNEGLRLGTTLLFDTYEEAFKHLNILNKLTIDDGTFIIMKIELEE